MADKMVRELKREVVDEKEPQLPVYDPSKRSGPARAATAAVSSDSAASGDFAASASSSSKKKGARKLHLDQFISELRREDPEMESPYEFNVANFRYHPVESDLTVDDGSQSKEAATLESDAAASAAAAAERLRRIRLQQAAAFWQQDHSDQEVIPDDGMRAITPGSCVSGVDR